MLTDPPERPGARNACEPTVIRALELWKVTLVREEHLLKASDSRGRGRGRGCGREEVYRYRYSKSRI